MKITAEIGLKISFEYLSGNDSILELIKQLAGRHGIRGYLTRKGDRVEIIVSAPADRLQNFSKDLGDLMPYSIFMSEASVEPVEPVSDFVAEGFEIRVDTNILPQNLSICPSCLKELFDKDSRRFYFPFISCNYCGGHYAYMYEYPFEREKTVFKFFQMCEKCAEEAEDKSSFRYHYPLISCHECLTPIYLKKGEHERYGFDGEKTAGAFNTAAGVIKKGNILKVYTSNGIKLAGLITQENITKLRGFLSEKRKPITVMFTGFNFLRDYLVVSENELKAIASQEKPTLYLRPSDNFREKELVSPFGYIYAKLPDDPVLLLLSAHLKEEGIKYVFLENFDERMEGITDFELNADLPVLNKQDDMLCIIMDRYTVIEQGEKGVLPNIVKTTATGNLSIAGDYAALDLGDGEYLIDRKEKILHQLDQFVDRIKTLSVLDDRYEVVEVPYDEKKGFYDFQGAILSVLAENRVLDRPAVGIYLSKYSDHNLIAVKSHTRPLTPVIEIKPVRIYPDINQSVKWVLQQIKESSPEGEKLISNLFNRFPDFAEKIDKTELSESYKEASNITAIFNVIAVILDIFPYEASDYFEEPFLFLSKEAVEFKGKKGVRIDYNLVEEDGRFLLNWVKTVQSVISYKLAGAEKDMLAYSVMEGFGDWIINEVSVITSKLKIDNIAIAGDMLTEPVIAGKLINAFTKGKNLYMNRRLPVDRQNIALGGIFV
ncbi:hypothetical protein [Persephonella sp.]